MIPSPTPSPSSNQSGRRVRHSRGGCAFCKERRIRCSEERPSCARCLKDGRRCEYTLRLVWEDESRGRGVKHGRATSESQPAQLVKMTPECLPQGYGSYFLNTNVSDIEENTLHSLAISRKLRTSMAPRVCGSLSMYDLGSADGALLQYYQFQVCHELTLVDDPSNGYRHIILPMSVTYSSVMESVLAISSLYLSLRNPGASVDYHAIALRHKAKALSSLRQELTSRNGSASAHLLVSMLMLCLLEITDNCQTSWPTHLSAAATLIRSGSVALHDDPALSSFVLKFFAFRDVMSRTACGARSKFNQVASRDLHQVDSTFGCSYELMEIISSITDLARQMPDDERHRPTAATTARLLTLESQLDHLTQHLPPSRSPSPPPESLLLLSRTSTLVATAARIYFHTTLHAATPATPLVQALVRAQIDLLGAMPALRAAHLWAVFVAALYVADDAGRVFFLRQFDRLEAASAAVGQTQAARAVVETVWKGRDLEAGAGAGAREGGGEKGAASDWKRLVGPLSEGLSLA